MAASQVPLDVTSLEDAERNATEFYSAELKEHLAFTTLVHNLITAAVAGLPEMTADEVPQQTKILIALLIRLANDLRTTQLLALNGYCLQALTIVSSMYEVSHTVLLIADDPAAAAAWAGHRLYTEAWKRPKKLAREALAAYGAPASFEADYEVYIQLCMAKHANTILQALHGIRFGPKEVTQYMGPDKDEQAISSSWFALEHAGRLARRAVTAFMKSHAELYPEGLRPHLLEHLTAANDLLNRVHEAGCTRFPDGG